MLKLLVLVLSVVAIANARCTVYTVKGGDTLSAIALRHLGSANAWRALYARNQAVVGNNPHYILPGQQLQICPSDGFGASQMGPFPQQQPQPFSFDPSSLPVFGAALQEPQVKKENLPIVPVLPGAQPQCTAGGSCSSSLVQQYKKKSQQLSNAQFTKKVDKQVLKTKLSDGSSSKSVLRTLEKINADKTLVKVRAKEIQRLATGSVNVQRAIAKDIVRGNGDVKTLTKVVQKIRDSDGKVVNGKTNRIEAVVRDDKTVVKVLNKEIRTLENGDRHIYTQRGRSVDKTRKDNLFNRVLGRDGNRVQKSNYRESYKIIKN